MSKNMISNGKKKISFLNSVTKAKNLEISNFEEQKWKFLFFLIKKKKNKKKGKNWRIQEISD